MVRHLVVLGCDVDIISFLSARDAELASEGAGIFGSVHLRSASIRAHHLACAAHSFSGIGCHIGDGTERGVARVVKHGSDCVACCKISADRGCCLSASDNLNEVCRHLYLM